MKNNQIANGWTLRGNASGSPYHFAHTPLAWAEHTLETVKEDLYVVETINLTCAGPPSDRLVHRNLYFEWGIQRAIGLGAYLIIQSLDVAEEVVGVRPATPDETEVFMRVWDHFSADAPAISDEQVAALPEHVEELDDEE